MLWLKPQYRQKKTLVQKARNKEKTGCGMRRKAARVRGGVLVFGIVTSAKNIKVDLKKLTMFFGDKVHNKTGKEGEGGKNENKAGDDEGWKTFNETSLEELYKDGDAENERNKTEYGGKCRKESKRFEFANHIEDLE